MTATAARRRLELTQPVVVLVVIAVVAGVIAIAFVLQWRAEHGAFTPVTGKNVLAQREIDKLDAEIRQIRSDTSGSLFWLKLAGVFVTVGAAVGGYLLGQTRTTRERAEAERQIARQRLDFDHRQTVDATYQVIVQELSSESALLRVASAMKLGKLLEAPPVEWHVSEQRTRELSTLTKQVLAASLAIERERKVLKALTIAIGLHAPHAEAADLRGLDLSGARAADAYWARIDFTYADFYRADLSNASFRKARLESAQFRETTLQSAVLVEAMCANANFKLADLRGADFSGADLRGANFEDVKVFGVKLDAAQLGDNPDCHVDLSPDGDGSQRLRVTEWLAQTARPGGAGSSAS
jgi:Pentapeptide repeats (9 copies)